MDIFPQNDQPEEKYPPNREPGYIQHVQTRFFYRNKPDYRNGDRNSGSSDQSNSHDDADDALENGFGRRDSSSQDRHNMTSNDWSLRSNGTSKQEYGGYNQNRKFNFDDPSRTGPGTPAASSDGGDRRNSTSYRGRPTRYEVDARRDSAGFADWHTKSHFRSAGFDHGSWDWESNSDCPQGGRDSTRFSKNRPYVGRYQNQRSPNSGAGNYQTDSRQNGHQFRKPSACSSSGSDQKINLSTTFRSDEPVARPSEKTSISTSLLGELQLVYDWLVNTIAFLYSLNGKIGPVWILGYHHDHAYSKYIPNLIFK